MRLFDYLDKAAEAAPTSVAIVQGETTVSYGELAAESRRFANALNASELEDGAIVATWLPNDTSFFVCQYGTHRTKKVWMPISPRATRNEAVELLNAFGVRWLVVHHGFAARLDEIRAQVPGLVGLVVAGGTVGAYPSLADWIGSQADAYRDADVGPLDFVTLLTTGGSTGLPKGVERTSLNWTTMIANYRMALPLDAPPVNLAVTPLSHVAGDIALATFAQGGTVVLCPDTKPGTVLDQIEKHRISTAFLPPTLAYGLLAEDGVRTRDFSSLRYLIYGSAPMSLAKLREAWEVFGPVMTQIYGLTEITSTAAIMSPGEHDAALRECPARLASCGRGSPSIVVGVVDDDGKPVRVGERGEVALRGNALMRGYFGNAEATGAAVRDGWFRTGDIGYLDESGYLYLVDRKKDLIISGGFNVYPGEVEQIVWKHPSVKDCAVVGLPDEKWGEAVTAVVELKPGQTLVEQELIEQCRLQLGSVKAPKKIVIWDALPRSTVGKVLKKDIRAHFWKETGRAI
ncbi:class I adenylate-forming enzyme family protein [Bradyrhizobium sp. CCBAU 25338]|uniref:class I adenylate-forming enzyme family protein n=1 Tax=Bradyrhizobium sp. CCBAU 25338 TaxID=1641877 RepID=UPI0023024AD3|nr:AMP-binding protein [Bradyrhizobium sp. CCBAU 25338]MDA9529024.1 hypothetical protein [Bradyrhizobium sp. CCBAU 25338]